MFAEIASWQAITGRTQAPEELAAHVMVRTGAWKYVWNRTGTRTIDVSDDLDNLTRWRNLLATVAQHARVQELRQQIAEMVKGTGPGIYDWYAQVG